MLLRHFTPERFSHLALCPVLRQVFALFTRFVRKYDPNVTLTEDLIWLGLAREQPLPSALSALHIILWKFVGIALVRVETDNAKFKPRRIWSDALRRFSVRITAHKEHIRRWLHARDLRGEMGIPPNALDRHNSTLAPVATLSEEGTFTDDARYFNLIARTRARTQVRARNARAHKRTRAHPTLT